MVTQVQFRRGTTAQHASFTGANGEITIDTDKKTAVVHDGTTAGGNPLATASGLTANIAAYLPTYTGIVNGSSHTVSSSFIANSTGVYHTGTVNAASHTVGTSTIANSTGVYTGVVNGSSITVGTSTIANSTGVYTGVVNGSSITVGTSFIANTTQVTIASAIPFSANGGVGTSGYILYSNGAIGSPYWAAAPAIIGNNGIVSNSSGIFVNANTGLVANTTGLFVNATYIGTISANNASYLGGTAASGYQTTAGLSANVLTLSANNTTYVNGKTESNLNVNNATTAYSKNEGNLNVNNSVYFNGTSSSSYVLLAGNQTFTGGFNVTAYNLGTLSAGTTTLSGTSGNYQYYTNNGAHTIAAPASDCAIDILVTNGASAGSITLSGFTAPSGGGGDTYATTSTYKYLLLVRRIAGTATYAWKALQ